MILTWKRALGMTLILGSSATAYAAGVIVAAGGGTEGDIGDTTAWSYTLYQKLVENGDVTGDGLVTVAVLSTGTETSWIPNYFLWLGADVAFNVRVTTRGEADNPAVVDPVASADVVFIKGGDQGEYYDAWNDTLLESHILTVADVYQGAIGGTSAGAMSQAEYCLAGSQDLISLDVLQDAQTPYLDDTDGGSSIHTDFLNLVPNVTIDTHYTSRGRMGRMMGVMGKAIQDNGNQGVMGIGIEERTGLAIVDGVAEVIGIGTVDFIQQTPFSVLVRDSRRPLYFTHLRLDRLSEGWRFDLSARLPDTQNRPSSSVAVTYAGDSSPNSGGLAIRGSSTSDEEKFQRTVSYDPYPYRTQPGTSSPFIKNSLGIGHAHDSDYRGAVQESLFRAMYDYPSFSGFLVAFEGMLFRNSSSPDLVQFQRNGTQKEPEAATLVVDGKQMTYKDLSPYIANADSGTRSLQAAALINCRVHALAESRSRGGKYDSQIHSVVGGPTIR